MTALLCLASVGRSGSTFLQRLLNTHPDIVLFGEHEGFLRGIRSAYERLAAPRTVALLETGRRRLGAILEAEPVTDAPGGWSIEWTNALRPADVAPAFARFVKDLVYPPDIRSPSHRYWGFKEIRYGVEELRFLRTVFPDSRFLMLARDPMEVYRSQSRLGWGREIGAVSAAEVFHRDFSALADAWDAGRSPDGLGGRTQLVCYEQLVADPIGHLRRIAEWLGVAPFDEAKAMAVVAAQMTPQRELWTAESEAFLDAYRAGHAATDLRRYRAMRACAIGAPAAPAAPEAGDDEDAGEAAERPRPAAPTVLALPHRSRGAADRRKLVFLHLPMTGGTTLHEQIATSFDPAEICPHRFGLPQDCTTEQLDRYRFFSGQFSPDEIRRIPGETFVFTVLRDPIERLRSLCDVGAVDVVTPPPAGAGDAAVIRFPRNRGGHPRRAYDNDMARQLAGWVTPTGDGRYWREEVGLGLPISGAEVVRLAVANLGRLDLVGSTVELDNVYARVADAFGLSQAPGTLPRRGAARAGRRELLSPAVEAELRRLTELDRQVYALARTGRACPDSGDARPSYGPGLLVEGGRHHGGFVGAVAAAAPHR